MWDGDKAMNFEEFCKNLGKYANTEDYSNKNIDIYSEGIVMKGSKSDFKITLEATGNYQKMHAVETYKLFVSLDDTFYIAFDSGEKQKLCVGETCIIPPGVIHGVFSDRNKEGHLLCFFIRPHTAETVFSDILSDKNAVSEYIHSAFYSKSIKKYMHLGGATSFSADYALRAAYEIYCANHSLNTQNSAKLLLNLMLFEYTKSSSCKFTFSKTDISNFYADIRIFNYIKSNYSTVSLAELSDYFGYTKSYICKLIRKYSGKSFKEYLNEIKLSQAISEIENTEKTIKEILRASGYTCDEHFFRVFKKTYGVTPTEYRKMHRPYKNN